MPTAKNKGGNPVTAIRRNVSWKELTVRPRRSRARMKRANAKDEQTVRLSPNPIPHDISRSIPRTATPAIPKAMPAQVARATGRRSQAKARIGTHKLAKLVKNPDKAGEVEARPHTWNTLPTQLNMPRKRPTPISRRLGLRKSRGFQIDRKSTRLNSS